MSPPVSRGFRRRRPVGEQGKLPAWKCPTGLGTWPVSIWTSG